MKGLTTINIRGIPFEVRDNTVDINVVQEVVDGDCYQLDKIGLRERPNIVDVGGHIGSFTKLSAWKWPYARIYTYEANPRNWELLERNISDIRHKVTLFKGALVGKEPVNKRLVIKGDEADRVTGGWGIIYSPEEYDVESSTASEKIENFYSIGSLLHGLDKIDILKLDCEGSEWSILDEMTEQQLHQVDYIVCELHCGALGHAPCTYEQMRAKVLNQFVCPELESRAHVQPHELFNFVACNRKLISS